MSDYIALGVITARHADLLREADEARLARICRSQQRHRHRPGRIVSWLWHGQSRPSAATGSEAKRSAWQDSRPSHLTR
jgi:hypothetical protein